MLKSAEYWLAGFVGLEWPTNPLVKLEPIIEQPLFNNSLAGYFQCNNSNAAVSSGGANASIIWENIYLANATRRFNSMSAGFNWTVAQVYAAQGLCPYETVAFGYSAWCDLFTFQEWEGFEYSIDIQFSGGFMFQSPTGRAVGIGYVQEVLAVSWPCNGIPCEKRSADGEHSVCKAISLQLQIPKTMQVTRSPRYWMLYLLTTIHQVTLDSMNSTFPLNQTLYFDFSHDTKYVLTLFPHYRAPNSTLDSIASILTAFGLTQFAQFLPPTGPPPNQQTIVSHMEPFGARLDIEVITAPHPVSASRTNSSNAYTNTTTGPETKYIHFILNQRTIPLGASYTACGNRTDGWCELGAFLTTASGLLETAQYSYSCNGAYPAVPYGGITNGAPLTPSS